MTIKEAIYARLALEFSYRCLARYRTISDTGSPLVAMRAVIRLVFDLMAQSPIRSTALPAL